MRIASHIVLTAFLSLLLVGCQKRIGVIVNAIDGSPISGAIVSNIGEEVRKEITTNENGMANLNAPPNRMGLYRICVTHQNKNYWGSVRESDDSHLVIFIPELDLWKFIGRSGELVRIEKSHHIFDIPMIPQVR